MASQEYYTPEWILDLVIDCMGHIGLDPCSSPYRTVPAADHYVGSAGQDGLSLPWKAYSVFANPPWGDLEPWIDRFLAEFDAGHFAEGILLAPVRTERPWFQRLSRLPVCFPDRRVNYVQPQADGSLRQTKGIAGASCLFYAGHDQNRFEQVFSPIGRIYECRKVAA